MARRDNNFITKTSDKQKESGESQFQTMYQSAFIDHQRNKSLGKEPLIQTPEKQKSNDLSQTPKSGIKASQRKFGSYQGTDESLIMDKIKDINQSQDFAFNMQSPAMRTFTSGFTAANQSSTSNGSMSRRNRCSDRFVKYPYPKNMTSFYNKEYHTKIDKVKVSPHKQAFNVEKEHKIINPHKMDGTTLNKTMFQPFIAEPRRKHSQQVERNEAPITGYSSYEAKYPNWMNSKKDIYHEKHPQYPYYQLPFQGVSSYRQTFTNEQSMELKRLKEIAQPTFNQTSTSFRANSYQPQPFDFETTNQKEYKAFKIERSPNQKQKMEPFLKTQGFPKHFATFHKNEFVRHEHRIPEVDFIPYP